MIIEFESCFVVFFFQLLPLRTVTCFFFNVLLTVHLSIILAVDQLSAQILVL